MKDNDYDIYETVNDETKVRDFHLWFTYFNDLTQLCKSIHPKMSVFFANFKDEIFIENCAPTYLGKLIRKLIDENHVIESIRKEDNAIQIVIDHQILEEK